MLSNLFQYSGAAILGLLLCNYGTGQELPPPTIASAIQKIPEDQKPAASAAQQLYLYDFHENHGAIPLNNHDGLGTTTSTTTTTTQPTTTTNAVQVHHDGVSSKGAASTGHHQPQFHGSDEVKVFFRDCTPYRKDCLFGGPVCASDKRTYPNFMFMECLNYRRPLDKRVKVTHDGPCWANPGNGLCPMDPVYDPVCGTDSITYANLRAIECEAKKPEKHHLKIKYKGECIGRGPCYFTNYTWESPVCVSTGRTLQSYQAVRCLRSLDSGVEILHDNHCTAIDLKLALKGRPEICLRTKQEVEPFPVCANDGQTYPNAAYVMCYKPHLDVEFNGPCHSPQKRSCQEAKRLDDSGKCHTICGSDGKNYNSQHHLNCAKTVKKYLTFVHKGQCEALDSPCVKLYDKRTKLETVCGTDGVSYISPLALECVAKYKKDGVQFKHMGPCLRNY